jgi:hypothetical protein
MSVQEALALVAGLGQIVQLAAAPALRLVLTPEAVPAPIAEVAERVHLAQLPDAALGMLETAIIPEIVRAVEPVLLAALVQGAVGILKVLALTSEAVLAPVVVLVERARLALRPAVLGIQKALVLITVLVLLPALSPPARPVLRPIALGVLPVPPYILLIKMEKKF